MSLANSQRFIVANALQGENATTASVEKNLVSVFRNKSALNARKGRRMAVKSVIACLQNVIQKVGLLPFLPGSLNTYSFSQTAALDDYSAYNLTSKRKGLKLKRGLKRISIRFSFTQNSTVSSITLNIFGVIARDMLGDIAITLSQAYGSCAVAACQEQHYTEL